MKTIILNQRNERDELMARPYLIRKSVMNTDFSWKAQHHARF